MTQPSRTKQGLYARYANAQKRARSTHPHETLHTAAADPVPPEAVQNSADDFSTLQIFHMQSDSSRDSSLHLDDLLPKYRAIACKCPGHLYRHALDVKRSPANRTVIRRHVRRLSVQSAC
jgi:hypothetical protein